MNVWIHRVRAMIWDLDSPVLVQADEDWGLNRVIASLRHPEQPLIWMDLDGVDCSDSVAVGDALSEAVRSGLGAPLFGTGADASYGLNVLKAYLPALEPITFVLTSAHKCPEWAREIAGVVRSPSLLLQQAACSAEVQEPGDGWRRVDTSDLALTREEALDLYGDEHDERTIVSAVRKSRGAIAVVERTLGLTWPDGLEGSKEHGRGIGVLSPRDAGAGVDALIRNGRWVEAFELAARHAPTRVPEMVEEAGDILFDTGQFERFWRTMSLLPSWLLRDEKVVYWQFSSAVTVNRWRSLLPMVDRYLERHEAPDVRALRATIDVRAGSIFEAERAYHACPNAVTAAALGFLLTLDGRIPAALEALREAMEYGERAGRPRLVISVAGDMALAHLSAGDYSRAQHWAGWALRQFHTVGLREELLRLTLVNFAAYTRLLTGAVASAEQALATVQIPQSLVGIPTTEGILSTLGDFALVVGDVDEAKRYYELVAANASRAQLPTVANDLVRIYGVLGMGRKAVDVAAEAMEMAREVSPAHERVARLALGCALAATGKSDGEGFLQEATNEFSVKPFGAYAAQGSIHLGCYYLREGRPDEARALMERNARYLKELGDSGWLLLGGDGPEVAQLKALFRNDEPELKIRLLGKRSLRSSDGETTLSLRFAELIAVLAANPEGIRGEQLALALYGDRANSSTLKATISRARKVIPIEPLPYHIAEACEADFVKVLELLHEGKVQAALELYRGPLLPESEAPAVVELREHLEESLRQAVLASGDADAMIDLANQQGDDLELWEETRRHLPPNDPRRPLANARIRRIRKRWRAETS